MTFGDKIYSYCTSLFGNFRTNRYLWDLGDEDHNGVLSRSEFFKIARKFEYYDAERTSLFILIGKFKKSPNYLLQDDDLRKILSVVLGNSRRFPSQIQCAAVQQHCNCGTKHSYLPADHPRSGIPNCKQVTVLGE